MREEGCEIYLSAEAVDLNYYAFSAISWNGLALLHLRLYFLGPFRGPDDLMEAMHSFRQTQPIVHQLRHFLTLQSRNIKRPLTCPIVASNRWQ